MQLLARKDRDGELPAVIVKNTARRAENMADAKKLQDACKPTKKGNLPEAKKIVKKSGDSKTAVVGSQGQRVRRVCLHPFTVCRKAVFSPHVGHAKWV